MTVDIILEHKKILTFLSPIIRVIKFKLYKNKTLPFGKCFIFVFVCLLETAFERQVDIFFRYGHKTMLRLTP